MLMALIAVAAVGAFAVQVKRRWASYRERATDHATAEAQYRRWVDKFRRRLEDRPREATDSDSENRGRLSYFDQWASYHAALRRKYEHAASYPWLPVEPDPPPPE